jgi:hypothetical protein
MLIDERKVEEQKVIYHLRRLENPKHYSACKRKYHFLSISKRGRKKKFLFEAN